jgi:restriction endonuclease
MPRYSPREINGHLTRSDNGANTTDRGRALEDLVCYLFGRVPGISITHRNVINEFESEEIDVALFNDKHRLGFPFLHHVILVEAKNWSSPVGSHEVAWFDSKLRQRGLPFGVLVAMNGITGTATDRTAAHAIIAAALPEQRQLIVLTRAELLALVSTQQLVSLVKQKLTDLAVVGTLFTA